ncbi:MAG: hypothetical protein R2800_06825 [Flavipsychrobacter sp.]
MLSKVGVMQLLYIALGVVSIVYAFIDKLSIYAIIGVGLLLKGFFGICFSGSCGVHMPRKSKYDIRN